MLPTKRRLSGSRFPTPSCKLIHGPRKCGIEADKPAKPVATSDWSTKDVGSATRILIKLADEGRIINIQIPQVPDLRRGIY